MTDRRYDYVVSERETLDLDILIVGGGPAGCPRRCGWRSCRRRRAASRSPSRVLEKAREAGAHMLSGAVLDPSALRDLIPDFEAKGAPLATPVTHDDVYFLTERGKLRFPITPPPLQQSRQLHHLAATSS